MTYDKPTEAERDDLDQMWRDQLSGFRNFEEFEFMGFLNELEFTKDWESLFSGIPKSKLFVKRLKSLYDFQRNDIGSHFVYYYPLEKNKLPKENLIVFAEAHVQELSRLIRLSGDRGKPSSKKKTYALAKTLSDIEFLWVGENVDFHSLKTNFETINSEVYTEIGDFLNSLSRQKNWDHSLGCLNEACYTLAADFGLRNYLMASFYDLVIDFENYFKLWVHGGRFAFDEKGRCLVSCVERREPNPEKLKGLS